MDVEQRLLLYVVVLGCVVGVGSLVVRKAAVLRAHGVSLAVIGAASTIGLFKEDLGELVAWPAFFAWLAVAVAPSLLIQAGRHAAAGRRFGTAWRLMALASGLLLLPRSVRREAQLYAAFDAGDRGDDARCRRHLDSMVRIDGPSPRPGSDDLVRIVPAAAARRWEEVLLAVDAADRRNPVVLAAEANAACETGDLRRALSAVSDLGRILPDATSGLAQVRRAVLAAGGRVAFLEEALRLRLPVAEGPPGAATLALARALEASADTDGAARVYREAALLTRGALRRDADEGRDRCERGATRLAHPGEAEIAALADLERVCRDERPDSSVRPLLKRAPATVLLCAVTALSSILVFVLLGSDMLSLVAAGALSADLIRGEGEWWRLNEWWRLASTMLLHGGMIHLLLNIASVLVVGLPYEQRVGTARTVIVYLASGLLASAASVYLNGTHCGVGASGAGMGLFGALCALLVLRGDLFEKGERRQWFIACALVLASNTAIGLLEREAIDNAAHAGGLAAGAVLGALFLPRAHDTELLRGARRLLAVLLLTVLAVSAGAVLRDLREWRRSEYVAECGVRVRLPAWLRVKDRGALGAIGERQPLSFVVQLGVVDEITPDPALLYRMAFPEDAPEEPPVWVLDPMRTRTEENLRVEECRWTISSGGETLPVRAVILSRDGVFAAIVYPVNDDGKASFDRHAAEIARTLTHVQ